MGPADSIDPTARCTRIGGTDSKKERSLMEFGVPEDSFDMFQSNLPILMDLPKPSHCHPLLQELQAPHSCLNAEKIMQVLPWIVEGFTSIVRMQLSTMATSKEGDISAINTASGG